MDTGVHRSNSRVNKGVRFQKMGTAFCHMASVTNLGIRLVRINKVDIGDTSSWQFFVTVYCS